MSSELSADSNDRASSDLVVIVIVFNFDFDLHLQSWDVAEDFVELVEFFFGQLKIILNMIKSYSIVSETFKTGWRGLVTLPTGVNLRI